MSRVDYSQKDPRKFQNSITIMHPIKKKALAYHNSIASVSEDEPLDFSTKKTATLCQESEVRPLTKMPSPPVADHPIQASRHPSPEESVLNSMQFRESSTSSPDSLPSSPPTTHLQQLPPSSVPSTTRSSPNGLVTNGMSGRLEEMSLSPQPQRCMPYPFYSLQSLMTPQYNLTVDTTQGIKAISHSSPVVIDPKLMHSQATFPRFVAVNGNMSPEYINGMNSVDPSATFLPDKKGTKLSRPFRAYPNDLLSYTLPHGIPDMFPYGITSTTRDQDVRLAQYTEQFVPSKRRVSNGQVKNGESKPTTVDKPQDEEEPNQTDSNSNSSEGSPIRNGNSQATVTSTGPSTSEQGPKRKNRALPDELKDEAYWERRRKNNEAAKRSRDARRAKEDEIAMRCSFLQNENLKLRAENDALRLHLRNLTAHISR